MNVRTLPKVELHCHLEGCFRPATIREVGRTLGIEVPSDPATFRRDWLITEPMQDLAVALRKFANIQSVWGSEEVIERLTAEACEDARQQNIRILELRYSPDFIAEGHPQLTFEKIHEAIVRGVERSRHPGFAVGLIGIVRKILPAAQAAYTTDFIIEHKASFVGFDFADRDIGFELRRFAPLIDKARNAGLRFTTHCGEDKVPEAAQHIRMAIEELSAERIGHGIYAVQDPQVVELARRRQVLFELCPTSNWLTSSVPSIAAHPIRLFLQLGVHCSINSDDPGLFGIDLTNEYEVLQRDLRFTQEEFDRLNDLAAAHSFVAADIKRRVWPRSIPSLG
ncbi:MAG TPA: adenosine deaminase [Steroidobacteraceae bacterium]|nr:adenosine deaminase [Steroidobacteraceae bacterium]